MVFHAGTRMGAHGLETAGGRVLGVTAGGDDLAAAIGRAYAGVDAIHFDGALPPRHWPQGPCHGTIKRTWGRSSDG